MPALSWSPIVLALCVVPDAVAVPSPSSPSSFHERLRLCNEDLVHLNFALDFFVSVPEVDDEFVTAFISSTGTLQERAGILGAGVAKRTNPRAVAASEGVPSVSGGAAFAGASGGAGGVSGLPSASLPTATPAPSGTIARAASRVVTVMVTTVDVVRTVAAWCWSGFELLAGWRDAKLSVGGLNLHRHLLLTLYRARQLTLQGSSGQSMDGIILSPLPAGNSDGGKGAGAAGAGAAAGASSGPLSLFARDPDAVSLVDASGKPRPTVVLCNPNAGLYEQAGAQSDWMEYYLKMGFNVVMWNYRYACGFGREVALPGVCWSVTSIL